MLDQGEPAESGFVDVATSLLAVILLATMMTLTVGALSSSQRTANEAGDGLPLLAPPRDLLPPYSSYHLVAGGRLASFTLDEIGEAIAGERQASSGQVEFGRWSLNLLRNVARDVDSYDLRLLPSGDWLTAAPVLETGPAAAKLAASARGAVQVPLFFVRPSGMDGFVALHAALLARGTRFRWIPVEEDGELRLFRTFDMFISYSFRR
jgi:hypothetical protein